MTTTKLAQSTPKKKEGKTSKTKSSSRAAVSTASKPVKEKTQNSKVPSTNVRREKVQTPEGENTTHKVTKTSATARSKKKQVLPFNAVAAAKYVSAKDKKMAQLISYVGPCRLELMEMHNCFETLIESIVYQQLTAKAASTILGRVKGLYGDKFPSPAQLLKTKDQDLRSVGLSGAKAAALKDLAEKTLNGDLPEIDMLHSMEDDEIVEKLSSVRGIGEWTVQMLLIFKLGRPDVMPSNDYGVRKGYARTFKLKELPAPKELLRLSEKWRPYRTIASWYLWRSLELP